MHGLNLLIFVIGTIWSGLAYAEDGNSEAERIKKGLVLVEQSSVVTSEIQEEYKLIPYRERRPSWGTTFALGYSSYEPINYEPDFVPVNFSEVYKTPDMPLIELLITVKKNLNMGSLGIELGVGGYTNNSDNKAISDSTLTLIPVRVGTSFYLDTLSPEPMFVPYAAGGMYTVVFKEELNGGSSNNGNTQVAAYFHGGLAMSLDWIDRDGSRMAFQESGIEQTFAYIELQKYMASGEAADGDFSNDISYAGGVKIEF